MKRRRPRVTRTYTLLPYKTLFRSAVERTGLREERRVLAVAPGSRLAGTDAPLAIEELAREELIVYTKEPRQSFADQVLALLEDHGVQPASVHEVSEDRKSVV